MPERIGSYQILRVVGEGGMGVVYEAQQESPRRRVAIKVLRPVGTPSEARLRAFRREIHALGRLNHPLIATIFDAGKAEDGLLYLVMELVDGEPRRRTTTLTSEALFTGISSRRMCSWTETRDRTCSTSVSHASSTPGRR